MTADEALDARIWLPPTSDDQAALLRNLLDDRAAESAACLAKNSNPGRHVALFQMQYEPGDWWARLSSFNSSQAHTDADGKVRFVASWKDPNVPNWLDASGRVLHLIAFRFFRAAHTPMRPKLKTVPLEEVRRHLPADTPNVSVTERHERMVRRLASVYRRRCGDF